MKHTPGIWNYSKTVNDYSIHAGTSPSDIAGVYQYSRNIPPEEAEANAKLIAAAPDLLQALQDAEHLLRIYYRDANKNASDEETNKVLAQCSSAVSKAIY